MVHWRRPPKEATRAAWLYPVLIVLAAALAGLLATCTHAAESPAGLPCRDRAGLIERLRQEFGERPAALGMTENGGVVELLVSEEGSWTLLFSFPNGTSCLLATGQGWESNAKPKGQGI